MYNMYRLLLISGLALALAACGPAPRPAMEGPVQLHEPDDPLWLAEHLDVLLRPEMRGRVTGSRSFALAAQYVEDRMREFRLQPALEGHYRIVYEARVHLPWPAVLGWADQDTAAFLPGLEFWPDARSDTGRVVADQVALCAQPRTCPAAPVWVLPSASAAEAPVLAKARSAQAVLLVGPLRPALTDAPISGLRLLQLTPEAAARLLALPTSALRAHLTDTASVTLRLRRPIFLRVRRMGETRAGALNVLGFVAGKDPGLRDELVIVCADLDVIALPGSPLLFDGAHLGEGVAALLELARFYSTLAAYWPQPRRTLLFAVWSGARQGHQGLRAYLRRPLWDPAATRRIVYLDPDPEALAELHRLAEQYGMTLTPVLPPDSLQEDRQVFWRVPSEWQQIYRRIYNASAAVSIPEPERLRIRALQRARALVRAAQAILLPEAITPDPWVPVREDTLRPPVTENHP
ncbi:M28 family peptidase [Rhodothermus marinus]|uniref:M28 family peptidase n=1 Tax=Rhodothermus marinus TaxID=29549 RepID=UPI0012BA468B|nr:M28 family peptidase [Rhodothermus marinus]BBM68748.1 hypothetical protein RmaAA213_05940 [Rhodothermus marinus]BBM71727.1 hypothetical protein RmaAA338_05920 [Rhodothermus marinus]